MLEEKVNQKSLEYVEEGDEIQPQKLKSCSYRRHVWDKSWSSLNKDPAAKDEKCFYKIAGKYGDCVDEESYLPNNWTKDVVAIN